MRFGASGRDIPSKLTGPYKGRAGERAGFLLLDFELNAHAQQLGDHFTIFTLGKKARDAFGRLRDRYHARFSLRRLDRN